MRALYYNCNAGISGDMNVAAMLDLGLPLDYLEAELSKLGIKDYALDLTQSLKDGVSGTQLKVLCNLPINEGDHSSSEEQITEEQITEEEDILTLSSRSRSINAKLLKPRRIGSRLRKVFKKRDRKFFKLQRKFYIHRHYTGGRHHLYRSIFSRKVIHSHHHSHRNHSHSHAHGHHEHNTYADIKAMIENSALKDNVKCIAISIFDKIARAEAQVHSKKLEEVAFHEVGAVDSIVDVVASAIALDYFNVDKVYASSVELGGGIVRCAHGLLPVPAPATAILAKDFPVTFNGAMFECTTPTGAGIIAATVDDFNVKFSANILGVGVGIGHKDSDELTNILRVSLLEIYEEPSSDFILEEIVELSANIDDMSPEELAFLAEHLLNAGALDVWQEPIYMKKGRLAHKLSMICRLEDEQDLLKAFFKNSTTYGIRRELKSRYVLGREFVDTKTSFGKVSKKLSTSPVYPRSKVEFEDKKRIALEQGLSIVEVSKKLDRTDS